MRILRDFDLSRLSYYSLAGLALLPFARSFDLSFWEVVRLMAIASGLGWLLLVRLSVRPEPSRRRETFEVLLVSLTYMFILAQFGWTQQGDAWPFMIGGGLVGVALAGVWVSSAASFAFTPLDRMVTIVLAGTALLGVVTRLVFGTAAAGGFRWATVLQALAFLCVYFVVSRDGCIQQERPRGKRLLTVALFAFGVVCLAGIWRTSAALYASIQAVQSFKAGHYDRARAQSLRSARANADLRFPLAALDRTLDQMIQATEGSGRSAGYMAVGAIAEDCHLWDLALVAYRRALEMGPDAPDIRAALGNSLIENGYQQEALEVCRRAVERPDATPEDYAGLGLVLAKVGRWKESTDALRQAADLSGVHAEVRRMLALADGTVSVSLGSLLPEYFHRTLERLTLFEAVNLLEGQGWVVLHLPMEIGSTGMTAPVDILASSGAGGSMARESIRVAGQEVSPHHRGYNLTVISPETGRVEMTAHFDTWEYVSEAHRLAGYVRSIPRGKVVVATVNDEGSKDLTDGAKAALRAIGASRVPQKWWSHAVIGIKGAAAGEAVEGLAETNRETTIGIRAGNVDLDVAQDPMRLKAMLRREAGKVPAGTALFLPRLSAEAKILLVQHRSVVP